MINQSLQEEAIQNMKTNSDEKEDETGRTTGYPDRPEEPDCIYYLRTGMCGYGDNCKFNHPTYIEQFNQHDDNLPERVGEPDCVYFIKTGICKYGSTCKYNHPKDKQRANPIVLNMFGLPIREEEKSCSYYLRTGLCNFGVTCKFHHPESRFYPSPQTYLPVTSYVVSNSSPGLSSHLPERPGEPECRYFMNTGTCKYGSECRYHHPMAQSEASSVSQFGLPLRPGKTMCSFYSLYGICKYGPACKYDHPLVAYSYGYTMDFTRQPIFGGTYSSTFYSSGSSSSESMKNSAWKSKKTSNEKSSTEGSSGEHVGSASNSSS